MSANKGKHIFLGGMAAAAAAAYFLDRNHGQKRRVEFAAGAKHLASTVAGAAELSIRDAQHRLLGAAKHLWHSLQQHGVDDTVLVARVRARMGRIVAHPHHIHVAADQGVVTLWGQASEAEARLLSDAIRRVDGVSGLLDHLEFRESDPDGPQHPDTYRRARHSTQLNWSPARRLATTAAAAAMAAYGWRRRDNTGLAITLVGAGLATQCWMKQNVHSALALTDDCPGFALERTVKIKAPVSDLYDFWSNPENYPKVFSHIAAVERQGENLYRWTIAGPAGIPIHWEGTITRTIPNTIVEWKSLPGSTVGNFGIARFDANYDASTRLHIRMFYRPPAGILGRFLAEIFGADPEKVLDHDLAHLKKTFEQNEDLVKKLKEGGDEQLLKIATT